MTTLSSKNDQDGSTFDGHSKSSFPDTLTMTAQDSRFEEEVKMQLEACSKAIDPNIDA